MQAKTQKLGVTFTFLFFAALLFSAYTLYHLPIQLSQNSPVVDLMVLDQLQPVFIKIYLVLGLTGLIGMTTVALLISGRNTSIDVLANAASENQEETVEIEEEDSEEHMFINQVAIENLVESTEDKSECFSQALSQICNDLEASQAAAYVAKQKDEKRWIELFASYAYHVPEGESVTYRFGEGLAGQVAKEGKTVNIDTVPEGYVRILSGLGSASPRNLIIIPLKDAETVVGVVEIASFKSFGSKTELELQQAFAKLALKLINDHNVSLEKAKS